jgi:hypothetical protein
MLGSAVQAQGALYYIMDYMVKDPTALVNVLSLINEARAVTSKYKSSAEDCDTAERRATHFLTRMINNVSTKSEVPITMAAAALLGMTSTMSSHHFQYIYVEPAITYVKSRLKTYGEMDISSIEKESADNDNANEEADNGDEGGDDDDDNSPANNAAGELFCVDGKYIAIPHHIHYAYRGDSLKTFSFIEYLCIIQVMPFNTKKITKGKVLSRESDNGVADDASADNVAEELTGENDVFINPADYKNARFHFREGHPLRNIYVQMIKASISVPILAGKTPPQIPQIIGWERSQEAQQSAEYYMALEVPWDINTFVPVVDTFNYKGFQQWCSSAKSTEESFINRCRFGNINNMATKSANAALKRKLLNTYRARAATQWTDKDSIEQAIHDGAMNDNYNSYEDGQLDADCDPIRFIQALHRYAQAKNTLKGADYICQQAKDLDELLGDCSQPSQVALGDVLMQDQAFRIISSLSLDDISRVKKSLSNKKDLAEDDSSSEEGEEEHKGEPERIQPHNEIDISPSDNLGEEQNQAFQYILSYVKDNINGTNNSRLMHLIVHGGPGVGKSTMAKELVRRLRECRYDMLSCAPTGIAASLLVDGKTIHSLFQIYIPKKKQTTAHSHTNRTLQPLKDADLIAARDTFAKCKVLLVDETSMIDPSLLHHIHTRLCQIMGCEEPFGGLAIVLLGDFFQLKPVKGTAFFDAALNPIPDQKKATPFAYGCELLALFKMVDFTQQYRSKDPAHTATINQMRTMEKPITLSLLDSLQVLSKDDVKPVSTSRGVLELAPFATAAIVVFSNRERHSINLSQARRFARNKGVPILQWKKDICVPADMAYLSDLLYEHEAGLTGVFVEGAPALMTVNLNATAGLANGTPVVLHSVIFKEDVDSDEIRQKIADARPGDIISIPTPHAVMVTIPHIDSDKWNLRHESLEDNRVVIPLTSGSNGDKITLDDQTIYYKSHPYDLAFAITFHKIQGQTVPNLILDLNQRPGALGTVDFHALYVGLTRVEYRDNIRLLPCQNTDHFKHLLNLKPKPNLREWLRRVPKLQ